jgi:2-polyprenyl-3-methyl-5-hydroxy-6-metoxy-1,4-benzoquinol methylase
MLASNIRTATCRYGDISYYADDQFIGHGLEKYGEYSEAEIALWRQIIKPGWTVLDVGANIGALTLPMAQLVGVKGRVFVFEPQPENLRCPKERRAESTGAIVTVSDCAPGQARALSGAAAGWSGHNNYGGSTT